MERLQVRDVLAGDGAGEKACIRGWIHRKRQSKKIAFLVVRDGTDVIQATVRAGTEPFSEAEKVTIESSVEVEGTVHADTRAPGGKELRVEKLTIIGLAETFPIQKDQSTELLMDLRHLWVRSVPMNRVMRLRAAVFLAAREYFDTMGFVEVHPPMFITAACEGGSTLFKVPYFGKKAYLTQSSQFYLEALITGLERVYCVAPSFRAEKSRTTRHLTEFWHIEAEEAFCGLEGTMRTQEDLVAHICQTIAARFPEELRAMGRDPDVIADVKAPFDRISYDKSIDILQGRGVDIPWGADLGTKEERELTMEFEQPFFVYHYPAEAKAFYHRLDPNDTSKVLCADMLAPEGHGEIVGGGERTWTVEEIMARINEEDLDTTDYEWYLDLRKYGGVPHAGFGLGAARLIKWVCGMEHIRDALPFPRTMNRIYP